LRADLKSGETAGEYKKTPPTKPKKKEQARRKGEVKGCPRQARAQNHQQKPGEKGTGSGKNILQGNTNPRKTRKSTGRGKIRALSGQTKNKIRKKMNKAPKKPKRQENRGTFTLIHYNRLGGESGTSRKEEGEANGRRTGGCGLRKNLREKTSVSKRQNWGREDGWRVG